MKTVSKTQKIRTMLAKGTSVADIAKKLKTSANYVYYVKWRDANKSSAKKAKKSVVRRKLKKSTVRDIVAAAHDAGMDVKFDVVPNEPAPKAENPLDVQVGGEHYRGMNIQPIQYIVANDLNFLEGCIVKRISRWRDKGGVEDLEKIKHEVDLLIDFERSEGTRAGA